MRRTLMGWGLALAAMASSASPQEAGQSKVEDYKASVVKAGAIVPPRVAPPCVPAHCPFAGQTVNVLMVREKNGGALGELKDEFEAATGARLNLVQLEHQDLFPNFMSDLTSGVGRYDAAYAGAWWLGELVSGGYLLSYDKYYTDPRFPRWDIDDVLPGPAPAAELRRQEVHGRQRPRRPGDVLPPRPARGAGPSRGVPGQVRLSAGRAGHLGAVPRCRRVLRRQGPQRRRRARPRTDHAPEGGGAGHVPFHVVLRTVRDRAGQPRPLLVRPAHHEAADREPRPRARAPGAGRPGPVRSQGHAHLGPGTGAGTISWPDARH